MKNLSLEKINSVSPYRVEFDSTTGLYKFVSDFGVNFGIAFEVNDLLLSGESYQFGLTNYEGKQSPRDPQLVYDEEDNENYAALIIKRDNPHILDLVSEFTNTIALLNEKPGQE